MWFVAIDDNEKLSFESFSSLGTLDSSIQCVHLSGENGKSVVPRNGVTDFHSLATVDAPTSAVCLFQTHFYVLTRYNEE